MFVVIVKAHIKSHDKHNEMLFSFQHRNSDSTNGINLVRFIPKIIVAIWRGKWCRNYTFLLNNNSNINILIIITKQPDSHGSLPYLL